MRFLRRTGTAAALWVAWVGIAVGGVGLAGAVGDAPGPDASESASAAAGDERGHMAGGRRMLVTGEWLGLVAAAGGCDG